MTCAPGHSADLLLRYPMPYGPFNEPLDGSDCYLDEGAFFALAWIEIIMSLSLLPMFVIHLRLKKAKTRLITFAVSFCAFASIANTIVLLCAMYKPEAVRATWVLFSVSVVGYTMPVLILMIQGKVNLLKGLSKKTALDLLGGYAAIPIGICIVISASLIIIGSIGMAATHEQNLSQSFVFYEIHCIGWIGYVGFSAWALMRLMLNFINIVEEITGNVNSSNSAKEKTAQHNQVNNLVKQFKRGRLLLPLVLPAGVGFWILHCLVIPVWWWFVNLHVMNSIGCAPLFWTTFTPQVHRDLIIRKLMFWKTSATTVEDGGNNKIGELAMATTSNSKGA